MNRTELSLIPYPAFLCLIALMLPCEALAKCTKNAGSKPYKTFPALTGRLLYHSYLKYNDATSQIYLYDFREKKLTQVSQPKWEIRDPMNAHFSPDGKYITFMGAQRGIWYIYILKAGSTDFPTNLTYGMGAERSEDPNFSRDGKHIVFKQDGDIKMLDLDYSEKDGVKVTKVTNITNDKMAVEESMPYLSFDGKSVLYSSGTEAAKTTIYKKGLNLDEGTSSGSGPCTPLNAPEPVAALEHIAQYFPIFLDNQDTMVYARWKDAKNQNDQIYLKKLNSKAKPIELALNDCDEDNSDPASAGNGRLFFSSTTGTGHYTIFLGDIKTGERWSVEPIKTKDSNNLQLGADYTEAR